MRKLLIVQKGAKVIMLPEFTRTLASNSADGFLKFAEEIRDLTRFYDQNLPKITEITTGSCIFVKSIVRPSYDYEEHRNLTPGVDLRIFDTPMWKIGLVLNCDIRCQLLAQIYCQIGCKLLL
ncbi:unnamed protein product [Pocillopora meandrina]|uniref:Uncharacterized protein n=1 Tax=Pocillopora meandrina TaxID=46732 RepID=A0AAU9WK03_9CNID|nr:unnamed protein product [Pocillopora meandrina]